MPVPGHGFLCFSLMLRPCACGEEHSPMSAGHEEGLPQLSALLGVPYCQLDSWLGSVSPSSPQLPQRWPSEEEVHESTQPELIQCSPSHAHQLISLAAFAAADAGQVSCCLKYSVIVLNPCLKSWRVTNLTRGVLLTDAVSAVQGCNGARFAL